MRWFVLALGVLIAVGCATSGQEAEGERPVAKGRAELWSENCWTCHNARSSKYYSDEQWEVAMMHMRIRGSLTGHETRMITQFLQAGND